ncbi:MAG: DUF1995 family protein [Synechococcales cyanobacterium]
MVLPTDLAEAQQQAIQAIMAARTAGYRRVQVEILAPELKVDRLSWPLVHHLGQENSLQVFLPDAGAAALTQRDWQPLGIPSSVTLSALGNHAALSRAEWILFACPNVMSIEVVEALCEQASPNQTIIMLNPQLQDAATLGIGLAARRLRQRFIVTFEPVYFLQSLANAVLFRHYPTPWQLWHLRDSDTYDLTAEFDRRPTSEELQATLSTPRSLWEGLQSFVRRFQQM